jgi:HdeA/HdeB family
MTANRAILFAAALLVSLPAAAQDIDMAGIKCKDFVSAKVEDIGTILAWLEGFYTKAGDPPILHVDKMKTDGKGLGEYCQAHPEDGLITAAETVMPAK